MKRLRLLKYLLLIIVIASLVYGAATDYKVDNLGRIFGYDLIVKGPWADVRAYESINAAVTAIGATPKTLLVPNEQTLAADLTTPATLTVRILKGGSITKASTYKPHFGGPFEAGSYKVFNGFGSGDVTFAWGSAKELNTAWWGMTKDESAANNAAAFNYALKSAIESGNDLYVYLNGAVPCNSVSYTKTTSGVNLPGITIRGTRSSTIETSGKAYYLSFAGLSGTDKGFYFGNTGETGQIVGMTIKDLGLFGPGVGETGTVGFMTSGTYGIRHLTLENLRIEAFGTGCTLTGPNGFGLSTESCNFARNVIGLKLSQIEQGVHNNLNLIENTRELYINQCYAQTFNSPILQTAAAALTYGVIFDAGTADSFGIIFNNPYFEALQEYCFNFGFNSEMEVSNGEDIWSVIVNGGVYALSGTSLKLSQSNLYGGGGSLKNCHFNDIVIHTQAYNTPSSLFATEYPRSSWITCNGQTWPFWYVEPDGDLVQLGGT